MCGRQPVKGIKKKARWQEKILKISCNRYSTVQCQKRPHSNNPWPKKGDGYLKKILHKEQYNAYMATKRRVAIFTLMFCWVKLQCVLHRDYLVLPIFVNMQLQLIDISHKILLYKINQINLSQHSWARMLKTGLI